MKLPINRELLSSCDQEIVAYGPICVFRTKKRKDVDKKKLDYKIRYGWKPLLLSTAHCFTQLICAAQEPAYAPQIWKLVVWADNVSLYTTSSFPLIFAPAGTTVEYKKASKNSLNMDSVAANIFMADMKKFKETVEMHVTSNVTIYNDDVEKVFLKGERSKLTIYQY